VVRHDLAASTFLNYEAMVRNRVLPHLGNVRLQDLGPGQIAKCYDALRADGANRRGRGGGRLTETSIQHTHRLLHAALEYAVDQAIIPRNPADGVRKPKRARVEMKVWDADQLATFIGTTEGDRLCALWRLAAYTGMRRSELLGLRWEDLDFQAATLAVRRKRVDVGYQMVDEVGSKSDSGVRVIDLDPGTVGILRRWRKMQKEERMAWGPAWTGAGLVFTREDGVGLHADHVAGMFQRSTTRAGVPVIRFHDLRHTHASLLLKQGQPVKVVSERLGHASPAFTMTVYQHVIPGMQAEAARAFAALIDADE
jgi:integrase